ncbi:hypothetical protein ACFL6R_06130 [Gemmatimonadota bacterium]
MKQRAATLLLVMALSAGACGKNGSGADTTPPAVPRGVLATATGTLVKVFWLGNNDPDFSHYLLYAGTRSDSLVDLGEELVQTSRFFDGLTPGTTHYYAVSAVDETGNESDLSSTVSAVPTSPAHSTSRGWAAFTAGEYTDAFQHFQIALNLDGNYAEAFHGRGWTHLIRDDLSNARVQLLTAISKGLTTVDVYAGLAILYRELPDLQTAIGHALTVVTGDPDWEFSHLTSIDYRDMHLLMAQCYFRQGEDWFDEAQGQVDILDPSNGLDPADTGTWIVGGITYGTYGAALMTAIMELEAVIGG